MTQRAAWQPRIDVRLAGARAMTWPTDWEEAFPAEAMARVNAALNA